MSSGLEHESCSDPVEVLDEIFSFFGDGFSGEEGHSSCDEADGISAGVRIDAGEGFFHMFFGWGRFSDRKVVFNEERVKGIFYGCFGCFI